MVIHSILTESGIVPTLEINGNNHNGYNGGGYIPETCYSDATCVRPVKVTGGGATDIRLVPGTWDNTDGLNSRIMVAGGG